MVDAGQRVERPWPFRTNTGPGGASWAGTMQPSCRTDSRPSRLSRTSTAAPAMPGRSGPGSNWRVCSWNLTVLSLATLLLCLKHRICSRHNSGSRGRNAGSGYGGGTPKRRLNRGRNCFSTLLASPMLLAPASRSSVTSRSWKVPAARSTRPFPWGDRAKIIWIPQLLHASAELGGHPREAGAGCVSEDPVPVGVQGDGSAATLHQGLHQQEVIVGVFLLTEEGVVHRAGGIVHRDQQREWRRLIPQPRVVAAVHLDQHALARHALAAHPVLGRPP